MSFGYLLCLLSFAALTAGYIWLWRGRFGGAWLVAALLTMLLWSGYLHAVGEGVGFNPTNLTFIELLRGSAWGLLLLRLTLSNQRGAAPPSRWGGRWTWALVAGALALLLINLLVNFDLFHRTFSTAFSISVPLFLAVLNLVLLEQWYRGIAREYRWSVKFFALATGIIFCSDFILYSEALLFQRIDANLWEARGWICAAMAPLMAISLARSRELRSSDRLSHQAVFFTSTLLVAGIYLLVMALLGYLMRWFGGGLGGTAQVVFVVLSLSALVILVSSGRYRALLSVWITKHFLTYKYDYRAEWMRANARFSDLTPGEGQFVKMLLAVAEPVDSVGGGLWAEEDGAMVQKAQWSVRLAELLTADEIAGLRAFWRNHDWVINLAEYAKHPGRYPGLNLPRGWGESDTLWLILPLKHQSQLYGLIALAKPRAQRSVNWEDFDLLKALAGQLASLLALNQMNASLADARQFEAYNQLSTFVVHDIKNVIAQLSLVLRNAERHRHNPEFMDDALETLSNAVGRMNRMLSQLKQSAEAGPASLVVAAEVAAQAVAAQRSAQPQPQLVLEDVGQSRVEVNAERLQATLCHLLQNAQEATSDQGSVVLTVALRGDAVQFKVSDSGSGIAPEFVRNGLFRPFVTTKGRAGMGIGVFEARQFARQHGGDLCVESEQGKGSTFTLTLPNVGQQDALGAVSAQG